MCLTDLQVDEAVVGSGFHLTEGNEVEDVLSLRDKIIKCEVRPCPYENAICDLILSRIDCDHILIVKPICGVKLWEIIQLCIEEYLIEDRVRIENDCAVLTVSPPWEETEE